MTSFAYVFPGQGSQSVGMMTAWEDHQSSIIEVFNEASDVLGYDLWALVSKGPDTRLNQTEITQPAMLCAGVASWRVASSQPGMP
jgi:[acyl-carrier-protein] S-malonyltransferase